MALYPSKAVYQWGTKLPLALIMATLLAAGCKQPAETLPFYNSADFTAEWIAETDARYPTIHTIDPFIFRDQRGNLFGSDSLRNNLYVANFFFTSCPSICPKMTNNLARLQQAFAHEKRLKLVSFSVTPWLDSVAVLKKYGQAHGINPHQWHLLTGNKDQIYKLGRRSFFAEKSLGLKKGEADFLHTEAMLLIDQKARIRGIYNATQEDDLTRISDDIRTLLNE